MKLSPIHIRDYAKLKSFFVNQRYPLCTYSLAALLAWRSERFQPCAMEWEDALVVGAPASTAPERRHLILPVSPKRSHPPEALEALAAALNYPAYWFVPEPYIDAYGRSRVARSFCIEEQTAYRDYIYLAEDLALLRGNRYAKKRNLIHQFHRDYAARGRVAVECVSASVADECIDFLEAWCAERLCDGIPDDDLACEREAAVNTLENMAALGVSGLLVRVDGAISGFGLATALTPDMGVLHFEKAFAAVKGLYQFLDQLCASRLFNGFTYINKESDMNIPGLARAKRSYHPVRMVRAYRLRLR